MLNFIKILVLASLIFLLAGCNKQPEPSVSTSSDNSFSINVENIDGKKDIVKNISILPMKKGLSKKDLLWCNLEKEKYLMNLMYVIAGKSDYTSSFSFFKTLDFEKSNYLSHKITSHLLSVGCVENKKKFKLELIHSVVVINNDLSYLDAYSCVNSEKLNFSKRVSLERGVNLNYKNSVSYFNLLDINKQNSIISDITNDLIGSGCAK